MIEVEPKKYDLPVLEYSRAKNIDVKYSYMQMFDKHIEVKKHYVFDFYDEDRGLWLDDKVVHIEGSVFLSDNYEMTLYRTLEPDRIKYRMDYGDVIGNFNEFRNALEMQNVIINWKAPQSRLIEKIDVGVLPHEYRRNIFIKNSCIEIHNTHLIFVKNYKCEFLDEETGVWKEQIFYWRNVYFKPDTDLLRINNVDNVDNDSYFVEYGTDMGEFKTYAEAKVVYDKLVKWKIS